MKSIINKLAALKYKIGSKYRRSYSQCGEDIIVNRILRDMNVRSPFYIDIGTNDPIIFSNSYLFYKQGSGGICVEPNPSLCARIKKKRSRDTVLNIGVGIENGTKDFYLLSNDALSTFSQSEVQTEIAKGHTIIGKIPVSIQTINKIISDAKREIDFLSLDIEGLDKMVLETLDFKKYRPKVICVETRSFGSSEYEARANLEDLMKKNGYDNVGYTPINSIYADSSIIRNK
ncbi:MAG TPA: FkbM family methyltransferase [Candidatus Paceibacterota bacterium]|nr:FkbM family methyltransferase [Candidatus Paceibacterota bacterium]